MAVFNFFYVIFRNSRQSTCQSIPLDTNSFAKCLKVIITYYSFLNIKTNKELIISRLTALKIVTQEQFQNHSLQGIFFKGQGREQRLFFCHPKDFPSDIVEAGWTSGQDTGFVAWWSWEQALHPATHWIVHKWFPEFNSLGVLCIQLSAACLLPVGVFTSCVYLQSLGLDCSYLSLDEPCLRRLVNFKSIQIHIQAHIPHIIMYNLLNQTDQI